MILGVQIFTQWLHPVVVSPGPGCIVGIYILSDRQNLVWVLPDLRIKGHYERKDQVIMPNEPLLNKTENKNLRHRKSMSTKALISRTANEAGATQRWPECGR